MYRTLLLFFLLLHMIGDYYWQSDTMADEKKTSSKALLLHCAIYAAVFITLTAALWTGPIIAAAAVLAIAHCLVDLIKYGIQQIPKIKESTKSYHSYIYSIDQVLHLILIVIAVYVIKFNAIPATHWPYVQTLGPFLPMSPFPLLQWFCLLAFLWKPANITIKILTSEYKPKRDAQDSSKAKAGAFIGVLERMIILLLMSIGQYAAIGLVLTAKSIARYQKISEDQSFAEYYLLGTLLSTLLAIGAYLLLFVLL